MSPALLETPIAGFAEARADWPAGGGRVTLEERLDATWRAIRAGHEAECPVCQARMRLEAGAGCCGGCGSRLS